MLHRAAHAAPAMVLYWLAGAFPGFDDIIRRLAMVYMLAVGGLALIRRRRK